MALAKVLAGEGAAHNILVNALHVGLIENDQACYLSRLRGGEQTGCADCKAAMVAASARTSLMGRDATEVERL